MIRPPAAVFRIPPRIPLVVLLALALRAGAPAPALAASPLVRVVLHEGRGAVSVRGGSLGPAPVSVSGDGGQVRVGGRPVGPVFAVTPGEFASGGVEIGGRRIRGSLEARAERRGLLLVNVLPLEDYVAGIVGRELPRSFADETLKAQAVAARTFALHRLEAPSGSAAAGLLRSSTDDQVYGGADAESPRIQRAVEETQGEFLSYRGRPILAAYHASAGGQTAGADEVWQRPLPYLVSQPVAGEEVAPDAYWRAKVDRTTLGRALAPLGVRVGPVRALSIEERSPSGRAARLEIEGARGRREVDAGQLRRALGFERIRSTRFEVRPAEDGFVFVGTGYGHGVGMSQWGAEVMARGGASYREILAHFYPGTQLQRGPSSAAGGAP